MDSMALVQTFGKPDVFVTFTADPKWEEITSNLLPGQFAHERGDLVARVFNMKLNALIDDLTKHHVLGHCIAYTYVVEYQKRNLPHGHILLILDKNDAPSSAIDIDKLVCAEMVPSTTLYNGHIQQYQPLEPPTTQLKPLIIVLFYHR